MAESLRYGEPDWNSQPTQPVNGEIMQRPVSDKSYEELRFDQLAARNFSMRDHPRLNSLGRHQDSLGLRNQDVLTVTAGDGDTLGTWKIHEVLLVSSSKFAEAAMKHPTIEKQTRTIRLSAENPDIFERYVKWLYSGFIDTSDHDILIHMYKLGERMLDDKFQDVCYSILRASLRPYTVNQILYILNNVLEHDRLHRLCLSEVGRGIVTGKYNFDRSQLDALFDFMPDLMRAVMDDVAKRSAFGQVHSNKPQPASIFGSSHATATQPPPPPVAATQHPPAVTATHYTPNIGWHFTSTPPNQPSSSTAGPFGTTSSAATTAPVTSSTGTRYGPGLFGARIPQIASSGTTQPTLGGIFGSTQTHGEGDRAPSSTAHTGTTFPTVQRSTAQLPSSSARTSSTDHFLFGPKFPHLQPNLGSAASATQESGHVTAQFSAPSNPSNPSVSSSSSIQTRNIFGSGPVNITTTQGLIPNAQPGTFGMASANHANVRATNSGPSHITAQGQSSTNLALDLYLGEYSAARGPSPVTSPHTSTTMAPASEPHFNHSGPTPPAFAMDGPSNPLSSSDKGKGKEREHDTDNLASDVSGDSSVQFTPSSSEGSQHQGPVREALTSADPSESRAPDSTDSTEAVEDGNQKLLFFQAKLKTLEDQNKKRLEESRRLQESQLQEDSQRLRESSPLPTLSECASTHGSDLDGTDEKDSLYEIDEEQHRRNDAIMQRILLEQQEKKRRMMRELQSANIATGLSATTTQATAAQQSTEEHKSAIENGKEDDREPPTDIHGAGLVPSEQVAYVDYHSQLMLLEAQNKKRLQMSRNNQATEGKAKKVEVGPASSHQTEAGPSKTPYDWTTNSIFMDVRQPAGTGFGKYAAADTCFGSATNYTDRDGTSPFGDGSSFGSQRLLSEMPRTSTSGMRVPQPPKFGVPTPLTPPPGIFPRRSMSGGVNEEPRPSDSQ